MTDFDEREEIYRRQNREDELDRVPRAMTNYNQSNIITMRVSTSCAHGEAVQSLLSFCLSNKDRWGEGENFKQLSWSVDKTKEFLSAAVDTFKGDTKGPYIIHAIWW
jgi:hypothetical protein